MIMSKETLIKSIREVPDFPIPGILFYEFIQHHNPIVLLPYKDKQ